MLVYFLINSIAWLTLKSECYADWLVGRIDSLFLFVSHKLYLQFTQTFMTNY
jgi:hypothetical protein